MTPAPPPPTSARLLARLGHAAADQDAWRTFLLRYQPVIHAWCERRLPWADADDVTAAVLAKLISQLRVFVYDRSRGRFRSWLCKVVQREILTHQRSARRRTRHHATTQIPIDHCPDPASLAADLDDRLLADIERAQLALDAVRGRVKPHNWHAFWRTVVEGQPPIDVARDLGLTLYAVCQARVRITAMLKREIASAFPEAQP